MRPRYASPILALGWSVLFTNPTFAQTAAPSAATRPVASTTPLAPANPTLDAQGRPKAKDVHAACKADAERQGLKRDDKRKAVMECVIKQRPDLAAKLQAKAQCRLDGEGKGLKKEALKTFVKDCAKGKA